MVYRFFAKTAFNEWIRKCVRRYVGLPSTEYSLIDLKGKVSRQQDTQVKFTDRFEKIDNSIQRVTRDLMGIKESIAELTRSQREFQHQVNGVRDQLIKDRTAFQEEIKFLRDESSALKHELQSQVINVRDQLIKDRTTFQEGLKSLHDDQARVEREFKSDATSLRDQLIKDRTTFQEGLKSLHDEQARVEREFKSDATSVRDQLIKDRTTFQEGLKSLHDDQARVEREFKSDATSVRDQLIKDRTTFQEGLKSLHDEQARVEREFKSDATSVRDQLIKDRTTFQEGLKSLHDEQARVEREFKSDATSVRDQLIKDRTTFQEGLKSLHDEQARVECEFKSDATSVRDQLIKDRTFIGERIQQASQEVKSVRQEASQQAARVQEDLNKAQTNVEDNLRMLREEILTLPPQLLGVQNQVNGIADQLKKDRPVFNRLRDSWLHPDYYYKNIVGIMEDKQRLLHKAMNLLDPHSRVLDVGPGNCFAMEALQANGHDVTGIGLELASYIPAEMIGKYKLIEADYNKFKVEQKFDAIWASHVIEHQPDKDTFVRKLFRDLKDDGWLFALVPPMKAEVVGGHLNLFNCGYLLYTLVIGGFDCSEAMVTKYGYNVVVYVRKKSFKLPKLRYDDGDLETLAPYFPFEVTQNFNGLHLEINWKW